MNRKEAEGNNKEKFCELMEQSKELGKLIETSDLYVLELENKTIKMDKHLGRYLDTTAGQNKANKRSYVPINGYMCADYNFKVVCDGLFNSSLYNKYDLYKNGKPTYRLFTQTECKERGYKLSERVMGPCVDNTVVNHKDGNTENNISENLEVVTDGMNNVHGRLMAEIYEYYADTLISREYNAVDKCYMHKCLGFSISCADIERYNKEHSKKPIKAFRDKKGEFNSRFSKDEIDSILKFLGIPTNQQQQQQQKQQQQKVNTSRITTRNKKEQDDVYEEFDF